jgi:hypothetical protein
MAVSGTTVFTVTRDDIIAAALRKLQVYGSGVTIPAQDITDCAFALNLYVKHIAKKGALVWCVGEVVVPLVAGQAQYSLGETATPAAHRPMRVLDAFIRDANGNDTPITIESRYEYNRQGSKTAAGVPNQMFYDKNIGNGVVTLLNVPSDASSTLHLVTQRQVMDFNLATDNPDFPQEFFQTLVYGLADAVALDYEVKSSIRAEIAARAAQYLEESVNFEQEDTSVFFTPSQMR